ncbi:MAG: hypothetical protein MK052_12355, partial [Alphaproteobacteria bacterium]|nr:hypothetical protein [Alphaproteobacteria bacterium]
EAYFLSCGVGHEPGATFWLIWRGGISFATASPKTGSYAPPYYVRRIDIPEKLRGEVKAIQNIIVEASALSIWTKGGIKFDNPKVVLVPENQSRAGVRHV